MEMKQQIKMTQQMVMTPQLQMAIKLLQVSRMELLEQVLGVENAADSIEFEQRVQLKVRLDARLQRRGG